MNTRFLVDGGVPAGLIAGERICLPPDTIDHRGRVHVHAAIKELARSRTEEGPFVIITASDLFLPGCSTVFGYADRARNAAIVSIHHLAASNPELLKQRLENEIAHEKAHLDGWLHCDHGHCLMNPVTDAAQLDSRPLARCGQCPRTRLRPRVRGIAAACLFFAATIAVGDSVPRLGFLPEFHAPFS